MRLIMAHLSSLLTMPLTVMSPPIRLDMISHMLGPRVAVIQPMRPNLMVGLSQQAQVKVSWFQDLSKLISK